ncbi:MAG: calcium/sodium antiporter [Myxococcales bacterium]|nr:calcium/sodium antiporter [Myxococcales bacterium]MDH5566658.1 calcium/sodium antiporter [Myxococcales bacterium]
MDPGAAAFEVGKCLAGLVLLYVGGEGLVRGASALAMRLGISALAVGLTIVAFGTSSPELVVSLDAALAGANDIAIGNVVGSNIANIALILGLAALVRPATVHAKIIRLDTPLMILASLGLVVALADGRLSRLEGSILLLGLCVYTTFTFWEARRESVLVQQELASVAPGPSGAAASSALLVAGALLVLACGGHLLVSGAVQLATTLGVSQAAIGLTIVAIGTSLPELATSLVASLRNQGDIAIGNIVGSNLFNILGILGVTAIVRPLALGGITGIDLGVMLILAVALLVLLHSRTRLARIEGALLLASYLGYVGWLIATA